MAGVKPEPLGVATDAADPVSDNVTVGLDELKVPVATAPAPKSKAFLIVYAWPSTSPEALKLTFIEVAPERVYAMTLARPDI